jgi:hypothetical protein
MNQDREEMTKALTEMIDAVEGFFSVAPWDWIYGEDGCAGHEVFRRIPDSHKFNRFSCWAERWMMALYPEAVEFHARIDFDKRHQAKRCGR